MNSSFCRVATLALAAALASGCAGGGPPNVFSASPHAISGTIPAASTSSTRLLNVVIGHIEPSRSAQSLPICTEDGDCSGGGGGGGGTPRPTPTPQPVNMSFQITVPARTSNPKPRAHARAMQANRHASYISQGTQSFTVSIVPSQYGSPQSGTGGCVLNSDNTSTCTVNLAPIPNQNITASATIYDASNGTGNVLSSGSTTAYIQQGVNNNVTINVDPYVAEVDFFLNDPATGAPGQSNITLHANTSSSFGGTIVLYDVDGYVVPDTSTAVNYRDPSGNIVAITPSVSGNASASVTPTSFAGHASGETFSGTGSGASGATATLTPVIGSESASCSANPLPPVCVTPAGISFQ